MYNMLKYTFIKISNFCEKGFTNKDIIAMYMLYMLLFQYFEIYLYVHIFT